MPFPMLHFHCVATLCACAMYSLVLLVVNYIFNKELGKKRNLWSLNILWSSTLVFACSNQPHLFFQCANLLTFTVIVLRPLWLWVRLQSHNQIRWLWDDQMIHGLSFDLFRHFPFCMHLGNWWDSDSASTQEQKYLSRVSWLWYILIKSQCPFVFVCL